MISALHHTAGGLGSAVLLPPSPAPGSLMPSETNASEMRGSLSPGAGLLVGLLVLAAGLAAPVYAQEPASLSPDLDALAPEPSLVREHWTADDGLPVDAVNDVVQTPDGYLWIATYDGLVRFDGIRFTAYRSGEHHGLLSNRTARLQVGADGVLWIVDDQLNLTRHYEGTFTHIDRLDGRGGLIVHDIKADPSGQIWFATNRGLARAPDMAAVGAARGGADGGTPPALVRVPLGRAGGEEVEVFVVEPEADGSLWLGTRRSGLLRRSPGGGVTRYAPWRDVWSLWWEEGSLLAISETDTLRVSGAGPPAPERVREGNVRVLRGVRARDAAGRTWTATSEALLRDGREVFRAPSSIHALLHDREGSLWVGTATDGLYRLRPTGLRPLGPPEGLASANVYPILQTRSGAVWVGGFDGNLSRLAADRVTTHPVPFHPILSLHQDRAGALWVGGAGLCVIEAPDEGGACRIVGGEPLSARADGLFGVRAVHEDAAGSLWVGSVDGLYRRPPECRDPACWDRVGDAGEAGIVRVFHERADGALWMGTNGAGLLRYTPGSASGGWEGRLDTLSTADGLPSDHVRALYEDPRGVLWVGTEDAGLVRLDPRGTSRLEAMQLTTYRKAGGLFDDGLHQILPDGQGRLWMSTNRGLFWVTHAMLEAFHRGETDRLYARVYDEDDGMREREANGGSTPAGMRDTEGRLWFPTQEGVVVVALADLVPNLAVPSVVVEGVGTERAWYRGGVAAHLSADERDFEIAYTAPAFVDPERVRFAYQLDGFDRGWVEAGSRRQAFYTNVPPGDYTFRVRAQNGDGVWSEAPAAVALSVAPRFYETHWSRALAALALLVLATLAVRLRTRRLDLQRRNLERTVAARTHALRTEQQKTEAQAERLREMDRLKSQFFTNVSHEFRTPLTLTIGPLEDLQEELRGAETVALPAARRKVDLALRNSRRLLRLIGQLLDIAKLEAGELRLSARRGDLAAFVRTTARSFVPLAERRGVHFTVGVPEEPVPATFDAEKLEQVLANLLSNAFKFTHEGGAIYVALALESGPGALNGAERSAEGVAVLTVRDNGQGVPADVLPHLFERFYQADETHAEVQSGTGIGLSLAKDLVELHGGRIDVESAVGFGTTFTVRLPLGVAPAEAPRVGGDGLGGGLALPPAPGLPGDHGGAHAAAQSGVRDTLAPGPEQELDGDAVLDGDAPPLDQTTVLIADDNAEIRAYVRSHLEPHYRVLEAADGREALQIARTSLPDLVLSDVMMPHLGGFGLAQALRADRETDFLPVVLLTARATEEDKIAGLREGADAYLTKPFRVRELLAVVDNLIASRQHLKVRFAVVPIPSADAAAPAEEDGCISSPDAAYLVHVRGVVEAYLGDDTFSVEDLAAALAQSRSTLHRRLRDTAGQSPTDFIRGVRLEQGATLLREQEGTVSEVAYAVGFKSVSHFSRSFRAAYGTTPSAYADEHAVAWTSTR